MRRPLLLLLGLLGACGAPREAFRFGPATPVAAPWARAAVTPALPTAVVEVPTGARAGEERQAGPGGRPQPVAQRGARGRARVAAVELPRAVGRRTVARVAMKAAAKGVRRPAGGIKNLNVAGLLLGLLGIVGAVVAVVGLLAAAVAGTAALPWLIVLGVSAGVFAIGCSL